MGGLTENFTTESVINFKTDKILVFSNSEVGLEEISVMLKRSGADFKTETDFNTAKKILRGGQFTALLSDVTDLESTGMKLLEFSRHISKIKINSFGFIRTEYPSVIAEVYLIGGDQCMYHYGPEIEELTHMMAHLYANHRKVGWIKKIAEERNKVLTSFNQDPNAVAPILMYGPQGTGKIAFSQIFHALGGRKNHQFIVVRCKPRYNFDGEVKYSLNTKLVKERIQESIEITLGHGMNGTVFFHEITELTPAAQEALANVVEEGKCRTSVNGRRHNFKGRIVVSTNTNLGKLVETGKFSKRLYEILQRHTMTMPSLSEYKKEIPNMAQTLVSALCIRANVSPKTFTDAAIEALINHHWTENINELFSVIEESLTFSSKSQIDLNDLPLDVEAEDIANNEKKTIIRLMIETGYNKSEVAKRLKISRGKLYRKISLYGIPSDDPNK